MLELHRLLLGDSIRNQAFADALKEVIVPGKTTVADIGSGTGFLAFISEKLGAKHCTLYEVSELLPLSKTLAKENNITHCTFVRSHTTDVKKPEKVDVIVSEILGNYALEENIIETFNDAHRFLKPDGVIIPRQLTQCVAPVTSSRLYDELNVWDRVGYDLTFSAAKEACMNNMYVKDIRLEDIQAPAPAAAGEGWGEGRTWDTIDFRVKNSSIRKATVEWKSDTAVTLYGFALWWDAQLTDNVSLSTSPAAPATHWKQIYLPLINPLSIRAADTIHLTLKSDSRYAVKINVEWETRIRNGEGKILTVMKQDMRKGLLS